MFLYNLAYTGTHAVNLSSKQGTIIRWGLEWCKAWAVKLPQWHTQVRKNESVLLDNSSSHTVNEPTAQHLHKRDQQQRKNNHTGTHVWEGIRESKGWWWLWHIAMPPTVVPVRGQSTSNWASVTHALCQSSSSALACNVWHIAEPPTGLLSPCPADDAGRGLRWRCRPQRRILTASGVLCLVVLFMSWCECSSCAGEDACFIIIL